MADLSVYLTDDIRSRTMERLPTQRAWGEGGMLPGPFFAPKGSCLEWADGRPWLLTSSCPFPLGPWAQRNPWTARTYVFIRRLVGADQVRVEARESHDGPDGEEAHHGLQHSGLESRTRTGRRGELLECLGDCDGWDPCLGLLRRSSLAGVSSPTWGTPLGRPYATFSCHLLSIRAQ